MSIQLLDCPECGSVAEVTDEGRANSTDGEVRVVRVRCAARHWFLLDADALARAVARRRASEDVAG